ncbi:hypothetical protein ACEN9F_17930 [Duganella sp. CT11-25]|uniref:hypothetical protein n=1 Tax=unclassified Duganella TaxID=2636909 RepID=UPI0039AF8C5E
MDFLGLVVRYPANRPLSDQERAHHLKQKQGLNIEPHYQLSVVKMNSTYLESVDKWFGSATWKMAHRRWPLRCSFACPWTNNVSVSASAWNLFSPISRAATCCSTACFSREATSAIEPGDPYAIEGDASGERVAAQS